MIGFSDFDVQRFGHGLSVLNSKNRKVGNFLLIVDDSQAIADFFTIEKGIFVTTLSVASKCSVNLFNNKRGKAMAKKNIETENEVRPSFAKFKSYSVEEILAAGGATAFADKLGKNARTLYEGLKSLPKDAFLTEEEFQQAMDTLNASK